MNCNKCGGSNFKNKNRLSLLLVIVGISCIFTFKIGVFLLGLLLLIAAIVVKVKKIGSFYVCKDCLKEEKRKRREQNKNNPGQNSGRTFFVTTNTNSIKSNNSNPTKNKNLISFNAVGVTYDNRQSRLKKALKYFAERDGYEKYDGLTNKEILDLYSDDRVYEYEDVEITENDIEFEFEPNNPHDPNAIKINLLADKTYMIGYVPKTDNIKLGKLLNDTNVDFYIEARFVGGNIKVVNYDSEKGKDVVKVQNLDIGLSIDVEYDKHD